MAAPPGPTWDALVQVFAAERLRLRAADRGTGVVTSEPVALGPARTGRVPSGRADCGASVVEYYPYPSEATLDAEVLAGARAGTSVVRVTAAYRAEAPARACQSRGQWEEDLELATKGRAEGAGRQ